MSKGDTVLGTESGVLSSMTRGHLSSCGFDCRQASDHQRLLHQTIQKVTEDIEALRFSSNFAVMMIFTNEMTKSAASVSIGDRAVCVALAVRAACGGELWTLLGHQPNVPAAVADV